MNVYKKIAGAVMLLFSAVARWLFQPEARARVGDVIRTKGGGTFRITELSYPKPGLARGPMVAMGIALVVLALGAGLFALTPGHHGFGALSALGLIGAAGSFANSAPANTPAPRYTMRGVYTGGSSDTSPVLIPYPAGFSVAPGGGLTATPFPDVLVVQAWGTGVSLPFLTASEIGAETPGLSLGFTLGEDDTLLDFVATVGCTISNTLSQP